MLLLGDWIDSRLLYNIDANTSDDRLRHVPSESRAVESTVDGNNFLGHEVGAWKGSELSWRGDDLNRTLTPQPADSRPMMARDMPHDSFRVGGSDVSFAGSERNGVPSSGLDGLLSSQRYPREYNAVQRPGFAASNGDSRHEERAGRLANGGDRLLTMNEISPWNSAAGLSC